MKRSQFALAACIAFIAAPLIGHAQYPAKPVRILIGYAPGGAMDIVGRVMADRLSTYWKQTVYVENRGGAAGNVAAEAAAKSAGDGYTLLFAQNGLAISAAALTKLPYKPETDLVALAPAAAMPHVLIVGPDSPVKSVQDLIARARTQPGKLTWGSSGIGNSDHLCGELFNVLGGIQTTHVPYKGGAPAAAEVVAGHITYSFPGLPLGLQLAKAGRARALAVTTKQRSTSAPDIPTVAEQGVPDYEARLWQGFFAPSTIAPALAERIARDVQAVLAQPDTRAKLQATGVDLFEDNQANFRRFYFSEIEKWRNVVKAANLRFE